MSDTLRLRYWGAYSDLDRATRAAFTRRAPDLDDEVRARAAAIVRDVRLRGDAALREMAQRFDGITLDALEVPPAALRRALEHVSPALRRALDRAAANIGAVHAAFRPAASRVSPEPGITIERRPDPLARVGIYAPGGGASYPSSVLMAALPARMAGVGELVLASPPDRSGGPAGAVLAAAAIAGVDRVFAIGGAGAIAAMAFGTETVPRVDRVVGPGNAYVAAAKLLVAGQVAIDCPAGPSEMVVVADASSDLRAVAAEMVAQAEHDARAVVIALVSTGNSPSTDAPARRLLRELDEAASTTGRAAVARQALATGGGILTVRDSSEAMRVAADLAPEHLLIAVDGASSLARSARNAGSVFVGITSSVAFGDYMTGANHVLPTGGAARSYSGLSPLDFVRWSTLQTVEREAARRLAGDVVALAMAEGLPGHATAARQWSAS